MKEILFRGKNSNGNWIYGNLNFYPDINRTFIRKNNKELLPSFQTSLEEEVNKKTVGQYTGLTDKNGTKIFEGDIVRIAYCFGWDDEQEKDVPEEEYISKVYSIDGCPFCVDLLHCDGDMSPIAWLDWSYDDAETEVIGNIHDNPELLESEVHGE